MHILRHALDDGDEKKRERPSFLFARKKRERERKRERKATFSLSVPLCQNNFQNKIGSSPSLVRDASDGCIANAREKRERLVWSRSERMQKYTRAATTTTTTMMTTAAAAAAAERKKKKFLLTSRRIPKTLPSRRRCRQSNTSTIRCRRPVFYVRWLSSKRTSDTPPRRRMKLTWTESWSLLVFRYILYVCLNEREGEARWLFLRDLSLLSCGVVPSTKKKPPETQTPLLLFFFAKKRKHTQKTQEERFPHSILALHQARIVSKHTHTHTHT